MNVFHIIIWITITLVLFGGLLIALMASRRPTPQTPGTYWLIVPVIVVIAGFGIFAASGGWQTIPAIGFQIVVVALLFLIGIVGGSPLVLLVLKLAGSDEQQGKHGGIIVSPTGTSKKEQEILRGGVTIGYLERLIIMGAALVGQFAAVAVVIAVKGLGRYSELGSSNAGRERFIIGTFVSLIWAIVCIAPVFIGTFGAFY